MKMGVEHDVPLSEARTPGRREGQPAAGAQARSRRPCGGGGGEVWAVVALSALLRRGGVSIATSTLSVSENVAARPRSA